MARPTCKPMGLGLSAVTPGRRAQLQHRRTIDGVSVTRVDPTADAGDKGIQPGDVVLIGRQQAGAHAKDILAQIARRARPVHHTVLLCREHRAAPRSSPSISTGVAGAEAPQQ